MEQVTTNQVKEMIDQLAAMTAAASITPEIVASIFEKMRNLNDQEREKVVKVATEYIEEIRQTGVDAEKCATNNGSNVQKELDTLGQTIDNFNVKNKDGLYVVDAKGNIIARIDKDGLKTPEVNTRKVSNDSDTFYVCDKMGNVAVKIDSSGLSVLDLKILYNNNPTDIVSIIRSIGGGNTGTSPDGGGSGNALNEWEGKVYATYGDSVTAINNGDFEAPYTEKQISDAWGTRVAAHLGFSKCYGRGIGGQKFTWGNTSGAVAWVTPQGNHINRLDNQNYDNFDGTTYPSGVNQTMEENGTAIRIRGCGCSWLRITKMFPESIKDNIDVVSIMYHNDAGGADTASTWVEGNTTDAEWAESSYYATYNGDYNIETIKGGIASTIMKLQAWMPNAILVLCTPISGNGVSGQIDTKAGNITQASDRNMIKLADMVMEMSKMFHIPCIDVNRNDGINGLNRTRYIADTIHPYTEDGRKMVARAIIGGLKTILPNF